MSVAVDHYVLKLSESDRIIVESLRQIIKYSHKDISEALKYGLPFYNLGKPLCYIHKRKDKVIVIGFLNGKIMQSKFPVLTSDKQKRVAHLEIPNIDYLIESEGEVQEILNEAVLLNQ